MKHLLWLLLVGSAQAQTFGLHTVSVHDGGELNNVNPGVYIRLANGATFGAFRNSLRRDSVYAAYTVETQQYNKFSAAITIGGITGYQRKTWEGQCMYGKHSTKSNPCFAGDSNSVLKIMFAPSVAFHADIATVRLGVIPRFGGPGTAFHLMVEKRFK